MEIKQVNIEEMKPFKGNPKKHPPEQIQKIVESIEEFGWTNPILVSQDDMVIAGHARIEAARKAGMKKVPVIYLPFSGKKAMAYNLADNKLAESEWNFSKLADLLVELDDGEFDMSLTGFDEAEIEKLLNTVPELEKPEVEFAEELREQHNYLVLYFDNELDWIQIQTLFDLKTVESKHALKHWGVGRVLKGADAIQKIREALRSGN